MGYARYEITRNDGTTIEAGYTVETICDQTDCNEKIDRGLYHLCGNTLGGDEYGCGGYFCDNHLFLSSGAPVSEGLCSNCSDRYEREHGTEDESDDAMSVTFNG